VSTGRETVTSRKRTMPVAVGDGNIFATVFQWMSDGAAKLRVRYLHYIHSTRNDYLYTIHHYSKILRRWSNFSKPVKYVDIMRPAAYSYVHINLGSSAPFWFRVTSPQGTDRQTDRQTDGLTDGETSNVAYQDCCIIIRKVMTRCCRFYMHSMQLSRYVSAVIIVSNLD